MAKRRTWFRPKLTTQAWLVVLNTARDMMRDPEWAQYGFSRADAVDSAFAAVIEYMQGA